MFTDKPTDDCKYRTSMREGNDVVQRHAKHAHTLRKNRLPKVNISASTEDGKNACTVQVG